MVSVSHPTAPAISDAPEVLYVRVHRLLGAQLHSRRRTVFASGTHLPRGATSRLLVTVGCSLLASYSLLLTVYYVLLYCLLPTAHHLLLYCLLPTAYYLLLTAYC